MPTALANAYIQVVPTTTGLTQGISTALNDGSAEASGKNYGSKLGLAMAGGVAVAAVGKTIAASVTEGADLQQSLGGVETMFGDSAQRVIDSANTAYKTAGLSANEYMETVTGFSASLLQSLGGDTETAAATADMALTDMSDNANKFGTDMGSLQYAYQGFAKQNYTMLDNLKLGYGGTKSEMQRLLEDAQKLTGVEYNLDNLNDVYNAIHAIQGEMGVTGTTAKEASTTWTGSFAAMSSAAKNVLGNLALGEDLSPSLEALGETVSTFITNNFIPMLSNVGVGLAKAAPGMIKSLVEGIVDNLPMVLESAGEIVTTLGKGLVEAIPKLVKDLPKIITGVLTYFTEHLPEIAAMGGELLASLAKGLIEAVPQLIAQIPSIIMGILEALGALVDAGLKIGGDLLRGIWEGIKGAASWLWDQITGWAQGLVDGICDLFGIHSPSDVLAKRVGVNLPKGIGVGWTSGVKELQAQVDESLNDVFSDRSTSLINKALTRGGASQQAAGTGDGVNIDRLDVNFANVEELSTVLDWLKSYLRVARMKGATA